MTLRGAQISTLRVPGRGPAQPRHEGLEGALLELWRRRRARARVFLGVTRGDTTGARLSALLNSSKNRAALDMRRAASRPLNNSSSGGGLTPNRLSARASSSDQFLSASARPGGEGVRVS